MIFKLHIETILKSLLNQEDTDGDKKITIEDIGPRAFKIRNSSGECYSVKGTYHLSNLLQELVIERNKGKIIAEIPLFKIEELPVNRISRMIKEHYWKDLTRSMDEGGLRKLISDTKNQSLTSDRLTVYVPFHDDLALGYYKDLECKLPIQVFKLPKNISPEYVKSLNKNPGILSLKLEKVGKQINSVPFVVPGGRFNEMYGWDSYFEAVGLIIDHKVHLAKAMADNFQYEIEHYGKILNANRSYYLTRTQPPLYSSLIREVFDKTKDKEWLLSHLTTAIKEYETVWMIEGERLTNNGLNRYLAEGIGITPEAEEGHYYAILRPYAKALNMTAEEFECAYTNGDILNKDLDEYFVHDRTVRESGHDTSYRIEGICADLNLVELNAMLFKYETDFAQLMTHLYDDLFEVLKIGSKVFTGVYWLDKANHRKQLVNEHLWNSEKGMYFDFNIKTNKQSTFVSATTFVPMWSNMASYEQAKSLVKVAIPLLKEKGGIAGSNANSRGKLSEERPSRQWDYPNGWAPHQMMIWKGLINYGFYEETQELVYRWLFMITKCAVDYNGTISEKYDVSQASHKVFSEYGNVGTHFEYITNGGFGWMNASYQYGLSLLEKKHLHALNLLKCPETIF